MSDWSIFIDFGSGYEDITYHCSDPVRTIVLHNNLEPVINTCKFIVHDKTIAKKFNTDNDLPLLIQKDAVNWFVGFIRPNFKNIIGSDFDYLDVEGYDKGILLQKTVNQTLSYSSFKLSDPSNKSSSIMHQLFYEAGLVDSELDFDLIDETLDEFAIDKEDNTTYWDQIKNLISEFGYVFNDPGDGVFELIDLFPTSLSGALLEDSDIYDKMQQTKQDRPYEAVRVEYHPHKTLTGVILFSDSTGGSASGLCSIPLAASEWYPSGSDVNDIYSKYDPGDGYQVIKASSVSLSWSHTGDISLDTFTAGIKKALIKFTSSAGGEITKFNILGNVVVRDMNDIRRSVRYNVADSEKIKTIQTKNITTETQAKRLANGIADWYKYSDYKYEFETDTDNGGYSPGDILEFYDAVMDTDITIRVIEVSEDDLGNQVIKAEGVSELVLNDVEIENSISSVPSITVTRVEADRAQAAAVDETFVEIQTGVQPIGYISPDATGEPDAPVARDTRIRIEDGCIICEESLDGTEWSQVGKCRIGYIGVMGLLIAAMFSCQFVNPAATPAEELLPTSRHLVFNFENDYEDQNGSDDWDTKSNLSFSSTTKKFGSYSLTATPGNEGYLERISNRVATVGESQSIGLWVKISITDGETDPESDFIFAQYVFNQLIPADGSYIAIKVVKNENANTFKFAAEIQKSSAAGAVTIIDTQNSSSSEWHYVSAGYDSVNELLILTVDERIIYSEALTGSWLSGLFGFFLYVANSYAYSDGYTLTINTDECLYYYDEYVDCELFVQHYNHDITWFTEFSLADVALIPATENDAVYVKGHLKVKSAGGFVSFGQDESVVALVNTNPSDTNWHEVDISAYVNDVTRVKSALVTFRIASSTTAGRALYLSNTSGGKVWLTAKNPSTGVSMYGQGVVGVTNGSFWYQVDNADVSSLEINLIQYYED